jgi:hypothetical protein
MKRRVKDEAVEMVAKRCRFLPHLFRWHGRCYEVEAVERCWTEVGRRKAVRCFRVQCPAGTFELSQDLSTRAWRLRRADLQPARASVLGRGRVRRPSKASMHSPRQVQPHRSPRDWGLLLPVVMAVRRVPRTRSAGGG